MNVCFIPLRKGSKSIPNKNHLKILNKPIFQIAINQAVKSKLFSKIIVSTDDEKILSTKQKPDVFLLERPQELSQDNSSTDDAILHSLDSFSIKTGNLVVLQCTSPLRKLNTITEGVNLINKFPKATVIGVKKVQDSHPARLYKLDKKGFLKSFVPLEERKRRQDLSIAYHRNGTFYGTKIERLLNQKTLITDKVVPLECGEIESINIDSPLDYEIAKLLSKA